MRESSKAPPDMRTGRSMRTCLSRGVPADHEARSHVKVGEKSSTAGKKALTRGFKRSRERIQRCGDARTAMQETQHRYSATAEQEERTQQVASVIENLTPFAETQRSWQTQRTRYLMCCCPESEAAMKTLTRVDTAREQRDRHFSRTREGEAACERETSLHRQQNALL